MDHICLIYICNTLKTKESAISAEASATDADEEANRAVEDGLIVTAVRADENGTAYDDWVAKDEVIVVAVISEVEGARANVGVVV